LPEEWKRLEAGMRLPAEKGTGGEDFRSAPQGRMAASSDIPLITEGFIILSCTLVPDLMIE
jgi:hypothetical protein